LKSPLLYICHYTAIIAIAYRTVLIRRWAVSYIVHAPTHPGPTPQPPYTLFIPRNILSVAHTIFIILYLKSINYCYGVLILILSHDIVGRSWYDACTEAGKHYCAQSYNQDRRGPINSGWFICEFIATLWLHMTVLFIDSYDPACYNILQTE
jgi:hypothetical protein